MQNYLIKQGFDCEFENSKMRCVFEDFFYRDYRKNKDITIKGE